jgi:hypothetical protein
VEERPVLDGQVQQLADHLERHRERELRHQVDLGPRELHRVEPGVDDLLDPRLEPGEPFAGELRGEQLAQHRVPRRVGHAEPADLVLRGVPILGDQAAEVVAEGVASGEHGPGLVVPADQPDVHAEHLGQLLHRCVRADLGHLGHRVDPDPLQRHRHRVGQQLQRAQVEAVSSGARQQELADAPLHVPHHHAHIPTDQLDFLRGWVP